MGLFSISSKQYHKKVINSFHLVSDLRRRNTHKNSLENFLMISVYDQKKLVATLVLQCLVGEGKVYIYNLNLLQIFESRGGCFCDAVFD
jgi:hypothetical protein